MASQGLMCFAGAFALTVGWNRLINGQEVSNKRKRSSYHHFTENNMTLELHIGILILSLVKNSMTHFICKDKIERRFRRLFGVPRSLFLDLVSRSKAESWFPPYSQVKK